MRRFIEVLVVLIASTMLYRWMWCQMEVDDAHRYVVELGSNRFHWDIAHVLMQPAALLVHRIVGSPADPTNVLTWINTLSVACGIAIFHATLLAVRCAPERRFAATVIVALSFNLVSLGPTAHIKLMVLPWLAASLYCAARWESSRLESGASAGAQSAWLAWSGALLGIGACFLVSMVPVMMGMALFILARCMGDGDRALAALRRALPFGVAGGAAGLAGLAIAYWTGIGSGTVDSDFFAFVLDGLRAKQDVAPAKSSPVSMLLRAGFSTVYNFLYLPSLGQYLRAFMDGYIPSLQPYLAEIARDGLGAVLVTSYVLLAGLFALLRGFGSRVPALAQIGAVLGGFAYATLYNLNDPEHWFQLTMPIAFAFAVAAPARLHRVFAFLLGAVLLVANVAGYSWERTRFDMAAASRELQARLGPNGVIVEYAAYPGNMTPILIRGIPTDRKIRPDLILEDHRADVGRVLAEVDKGIDAALERGAPVLVFRIMDESDWRGPAAYMASLRFSPVALRRHLRERYDVVQAQPVAGFAAWEIRRR